MLISLHSLARLTKYCAITLLLCCAGSGPSYAQAQLQSDAALASAGYFQLSWQDDASHRFELQQSDNPSFSNALNIYQGQDQSTVISGLPDGRYFFRVRGNPGKEWSEPVEVKVEHHSLSRAFGFFTLGAVMFIATLVVLIKGTRGVRRP